MTATHIRPGKIEVYKEEKNTLQITTCNAFYASKIQENVEGLFFQDIQKPKTHPC